MDQFVEKIRILTPPLIDPERGGGTIRPEEGLIKGNFLKSFTNPNLEKEK